MTDFVQSAPARTPVTAILTDEGGTERVFHGLRVRVPPALAVGSNHGTAGQRADFHTEERSYGARVVRVRHRSAPDLVEHLGPARTYLKVESCTGSPLPAQGLEMSGEDWFFGPGRMSLHVAVDAETITVEPMTEQGRAWAEDNLTFERRRDEFLDRLRALDPNLAQSASDLFDQAALEGINEGMARTSELF
jgi:hypothetical protein